MTTVPPAASPPVGSTVTCGNVLCPLLFGWCPSLLHVLAAAVMFVIVVGAPYDESWIWDPQEGLGEPKMALMGAGVSRVSAGWPWRGHMCPQQSGCSCPRRAALLGPGRVFPPALWQRDPGSGGNGALRMGTLWGMNRGVPCRTLTPL